MLQPHLPSVLVGWAQLARKLFPASLRRFDRSPITLINTRKLHRTECRLSSTSQRSVQAQARRPVPVWVLTTSLTSVLTPLAFCTLAAGRLRYQPMRAPLASINGSDGLARPRHSVETLRNRRSCESDDHKGILLPSSSSPRPHNPIRLYQGLLLFSPLMGDALPAPSHTAITPSASLVS